MKGVTINNFATVHDFSEGLTGRRTEVKLSRKHHFMQKIDENQKPLSYFEIIYNL